MATALTLQHPSRSFAPLGRQAARPAPRPADRPAVQLESLGALVAYPCGKTIVEAGDPAETVFKVMSGVVRTVRLLPDGRRHVASFLLPGDVFGYAADEEYPCAVEAVGSVSLLRIPRARFEALLESDAAARRRFLSMVCGELSAVQDQLLLLGRKTAVERIATFLLATADRRARDGEPARDVHLPMTRADIADYLGLTVETVSRVLSQLRHQGLIELPQATHVVFRDRDALEDICAGDV